jgi:tRNA C32,U32 (ribose-2'-O)-methylase TrmJ
MCYETMLARGGEGRPIKPPRKPAGPAPTELLERLFEDWRRALWSIEFFKTRQSAHVMRSWREIIFRADLDAREASLVRAMGIEVSRFLERKGIVPASPPPGDGLPGAGGDAPAPDTT